MAGCLNPYRRRGGVRRFLGGCAPAGMRQGHTINLQPLAHLSPLEVCAGYAPCHIWVSSLIGLGGAVATRPYKLNLVCAGVCAIYIYIYIGKNN